MRKATLVSLLMAILLSTVFSIPSFGWNSGPADLKYGEIGKVNPAYNDWTRFVAGIGNPQGKLTACEITPACAKYANFISGSWERFEKRHLAPMREWAAKELSATSTATVFYPFSGPDFVNMHTFFPQAKTYLMVALEPVGETPDLAPTDVNLICDTMQHSLYDLLQLNFFIRKSSRTLKRPELKGILPVLLFFLAREKAQVLDIRYWLMRPDGTIEESPATGPRVIGNKDIAGVRIEFASAGLNETKTLYYFRFNLRNDFLQSHQKFVAFLKGFGPVTTFAKAASYLMHKSGYSGIRGLILDQSLYVVQGDSAIPLKYFDPAAWNLKFFGTYTSPITFFKKFQQRDLAEIYNGGREVYPLPFGVDYRHRVNTSNLMFASKKVELTAGNSK